MRPTRSAVVDHLRYLCPEEKGAVVADWLSYRDEPRPPEVTGGEGWPDPPIFKWCDRLNAIPGVVTLQSCAGHPPGHMREAPNYERIGQLWLKLSKKMALQTYAHVAVLRQYCEDLRVQFMRGDCPTEEIWDLQFKGCDQLDASMEPICIFFEAMAAGVTK